MQNKRTFASRYFELFTLPASLRLNTQRRSAPSMCAFKEEKRSVLISVTLIAGYKTVPTIGITFCMYLKGSTMWQRLERKISFLNWSFVCFFLFLPSAFLVFFFLLLFLLSAFFFFHPHFPIRIRHPQVSGPRFTDTRHVYIKHAQVCKKSFVPSSVSAIVAVSEFSVKRKEK